ncbi:MAG: hypothetical protein INR71_13810 [Terriglobus roseus]|nr:hypothetical protein [Terriglobus roseus]
MAGVGSFSQHKASKSKKQRSSFRGGDVKVSRRFEEALASSSSAQTSPQVTP